MSIEDIPVKGAQALSRVVTRFPRTTIGLFLVLALVAASFLPGLKLYLSFYQLIPDEYIAGDELTHDYYDWYTELNAEYGGDNWDFYIVRAKNVTSVDAVREMNAVSEAVRAEFGYVTGTFSLAELVKIVNYLATGRYEFPPEGEVGDQQIRTSIDVLLSQPQYRNQIIGNIVSPDYRTAVLIIIFDQSRSLEDFRVFAKELKEFGFEIDESNRYADAGRLYPLNIDTIYLKLDEVTLEEGLWWVVLAFFAVLVVSLWLFRSPVFTAITLLNLAVVVSVTVAALSLMGGYLNLLTMLLIALIFGVGDDYTTYSLTIYRNEMAAGHKLREAVKKAQGELASALLIAALVTLSGFASIWLTGFPAIMIFGAMAGAGVFFSYLGCLTLVPACLWLYFTRVENRKKAGLSTREYDRMLARGRATASKGAKLTGFVLKGRVPIVIVFVLLLVGALSPMIWGAGVRTWNGSYSAIFDQDTYEMRTYNAVSEWMGIPLEAVVFVEGDAADPAFLRMIDDLDRSTGTSVSAENAVHSWVKADSLADVVRDNLPRYVAQPALLGLDPRDPFTLLQPATPVDSDGDGLPDDRVFLKRMLDAMWDDPATQLVMSRIVARDYSITLVRVGVNAETGDGISVVENARMAVDDLGKVVRSVQREHAAVASLDDYHTTGLAVVVLAVTESIEFGNKWTVIVMISVIFLLVTIYYRRPIHTVLIMIPLLAGVAVQYFLMSLLGYEMTYVAVILTSVDMGLGIDLGVHTYANFRERLRAGLPSKEAILESTGAINIAMIAALFTDMSAFLLIPWSDISWAAQTAKILLASVGAILVVAIVVLPALFYWDAKRNPRAYGVPAPRQ